jgi:hypothetical protein
MKFTTMKLAILSLALLATTGVTAAAGQVRAYHLSLLLVGSFRTDKEVSKTTLSPTQQSCRRFHTKSTDDATVSIVNFSSAR